MPQFPSGDSLARSHGDGTIDRASSLEAGSILPPSAESLNTQQEVHNLYQAEASRAAAPYLTDLQIDYGVENQSQLKAGEPEPTRSAETPGSAGAMPEHGEPPKPTNPLPAKPGETTPDLEPNPSAPARPAEPQVKPEEQRTVQPGEQTPEGTEETERRRKPARRSGGHRKGGKRSGRKGGKRGGGGGGGKGAGKRAGKRHSKGGSPEGKNKPKDGKDQEEDVEEDEGDEDVPETPAAPEVSG